MKINLSFKRSLNLKIKINIQFLKKYHKKIINMYHKDNKVQNINQTLKYQANTKYWKMIMKDFNLNIEESSSKMNIWEQINLV